jgi:hypothetical protein
MDETARTTEPETTLFLLTSHMDGSMQPWGVFSTPDEAKEFAQASEEQDASEDSEELGDDAEQVDLELEWREVETWTGELGWQTLPDDTYSGASWTVHPLYLDPSWGQVL